VLQLHFIYVKGNTRSFKIHTSGCFYKHILKQLLLKTTVSRSIKSFTFTYTLPSGKDYKTEKDGRITQCVIEKPNSCSRYQLWQQLIDNPMRENRRCAHRGDVGNWWRL